MKRIFAIAGILLAFMSSCSSQTEPIHYGKDNCNLCKMTIMDKEYACELVTSKGKVFKFDDVTCMVKYMKASQTSDADYDFIVVNDFKNPKKFIDVETGETIQLFAENVKEIYQKSVEDYFKKIKEACLQYKIQYVPAAIGENFEKILTSYLIEKQKFV